MHQGRKEKQSPYALGSSHETHFILVASLFNMQTLQVHVPGALVGALIPAAAQLKPPDVFVGFGSSVPPGAGTESGRGSSAPVAGHLKPPDELFVDFGSSVPGAAAEGAESTRGSSQAAHFVLAESLFSMQTLHVHVPGAFVGAFTPAAAQLKPPVGAAAFVADSGRGSSHETHLVLAASLLTMQTPHVHEPTASIGGFIPAASQLKPVEADFAPNVKANVGSEYESATEATLRSLA